MTKKYENSALVTRAFEASFSVSDTEAGVIEGTPIVFNSDARIQDFAGEFIERIDPHALDKTDMRDVCLFVNHDTKKMALARSKNGNANSTMKFTVDESGVHMRAVLDVENNSEARALYSAIKRGDMEGMSFMFRVGKDDWSDLDSKVPTRTIRDISIIHEVSVVNFPAYPATSVSARGTKETDYSPLVEARKKYTEETENKTNNALEIERLKNINIIKLIGGL